MKHIPQNWRLSLSLFAVLLTIVTVVLALRSIDVHQSSLQRFSSKVYNNGNSEILNSKLTPEDGFSFTYRIGSETNPHVVAGLWSKDSASALNLSSMDYLEIELNPALTSSFNLALYFHIPGFTISHIWYTHRMLLTEVTVRPGQTKYRIPLKEMHTPIWWYSINRMSKESIPRTISWNRCTGISVSNHDLAVRGEPLMIRITDMKFTPDRSDILVGYFAALLILTFLFILLSYLEDSKQIEYEKVAVIDEVEQNRKTLESFLGSHYTNEELSMDRVSHETGISKTKIRHIMKEYHQTTLNEFITSLRLIESTRLLKESKLQIAEIARKLGFKHISTFNHHFKKRYKKPPSSYRETK